MKRIIFLSVILLCSSLGASFKISNECLQELVKDFFQKKNEAQKHTVYDHKNNVAGSAFSYDYKLELDLQNKKLAHSVGLTAFFDTQQKLLSLVIYNIKSILDDSQISSMRIGPIEFLLSQHRGSFVKKDSDDYICFFVKGLTVPASFLTEQFRIE